MRLDRKINKTKKSTIWLQIKNKDNVNKQNFNHILKYEKLKHCIYKRKTKYIHKKTKFQLLSRETEVQEI